VTTVVTDRATAVGDESTLDQTRGSVVIADGVIAKLAARAVLDVADAGAAAPRMWGRELPNSGQLGVRESSLTGLPHASADVDGTVAFIDLAISVRWPASVPRVTQQVRDHVINQVHELTGLTVAHVRIAVTALITAAPPPRVR
jgi:uncharacterized alkaline shock family protein YloU